MGGGQVSAFLRQAVAEIPWGQNKTGAYEHALLEKKTHNLPIALLPPELKGKLPTATRLQQPFHRLAANPSILADLREVADYQMDVTQCAGHKPYPLPLEPPASAAKTRTTCARILKVKLAPMVQEMEKNGIVGTVYPQSAFLLGKLDTKLNFWDALYQKSLKSTRQTLVGFVCYAIGRVCKGRGSYGQEYPHSSG